MRVAIVTESFLPQVNGVSNTVRHVVDELVDAHHEALVVAPGPGPGHHEGVPVVRVRSVGMPGYRSFPIGLPDAAVRTQPRPVRSRPGAPRLPDRARRGRAARRAPARGADGRGLPDRHRRLRAAVRTPRRPGGRPLGRSVAPARGPHPGAVDRLPGPARGARRARPAPVAARHRARPVRPVAPQPAAAPAVDRRQAPRRRVRRSPRRTRSRSTGSRCWPACPASSSS